MRWSTSPYLYNGDFISLERRSLRYSNEAHAKGGPITTAGRTANEHGLSDRDVFNIMRYGRDYINPSYIINSAGSPPLNRWTQLTGMLIRHICNWFWCSWEIKCRRIQGKSYNSWNAKFVVAFGIRGCHDDNFRCHQWRQSWYYDKSHFSGISIMNSTRYICLHTIDDCSDLIITSADMISPVGGLTSPYRYCVYVPVTIVVLGYQ